MIVKNREQLAASELRRQVLDIIETGILRVLPSTIMQSALSFDRSSRSLTINREVYQLTGRLFVIGGGKASGLMAQTLEEIVGTGVIEDGLVVDKASPHEFRTRSIRIVQAGHPLPDQRGIEATTEILRLKQKHNIGKNDLVLCLISGGGSALMPCPIEGVSLQDKQSVTKLLLSCGANITEINAVRKHLSATKGGKLARHFAPAAVVSLILSDVIGNNLDIIASGPTSPDPSTFQDARNVLQKYHLLEKIPASVRAKIEAGCRGELADNPKSLENAHNYIIGDIRIALEAMAAKAGQLGFKPLIISSAQTGETEAVARQRSQEILDGKYRGYNCLLLGGETTPKLPENPGKGGRNQHYAAVSMLTLKPYPGEWVAASIGTDGSDYLPDVAGAIVDSTSLDRLTAQNIAPEPYLSRYDSNPLLQTLGNSLILTGPTETNVCDLIVYAFRR